MGNQRKQELIEWLSSRQEIIQDALSFEYELCEQCMPYDSETRGLFNVSVDSEGTDLLSCLQDIFEKLVANENDDFSDIDLTDDDIYKMINDLELSCDSNGHELTEMSEMFSSVVQYENDASQSGYLITKEYWPFLSHYTKDFASLKKIIKANEIKASNKYIKAQTPVVCLTECSPFEIHFLEQVGDEVKKHIKSHIQGERFSWNRSKYGIAIRRKTLIEKGSTPVIHGGDELFHALPQNEKYRYVGFEPERRVDWTFEREFRFEGNIDLSNFDIQDIVIVVKNKDDRLNLLCQEKVPPYHILALENPFTKHESYHRLSNRQKLA